MTNQPQQRFYQRARNKIEDRIQESDVIFMKQVVFFGSIGVGKTTAGNILESKFQNVQFLKEDLDENPFLPAFYNDMKKWGFDGALMSGSGSCVFGITRDKEKLDLSYNYFKNKYYF